MTYINKICPGVTQCMPKMEAPSKKTIAAVAVVAILLGTRYFSSPWSCSDLSGRTEVQFPNDWQVSIPSLVYLDLKTDLSMRTTESIHNQIKNIINAMESAEFNPAEEDFKMFAEVAAQGMDRNDRELQQDALTLFCNLLDNPQGRQAAFEPALKAVNKGSRSRDYTNSLQLHLQLRSCLREHFSIVL